MAYTFPFRFIIPCTCSPGVVAIYRDARLDKGDETTLVIWESEEAVRRYRESDLVMGDLVGKTRQISHFWGLFPVPP